MQKTVFILMLMIGMSTRAQTLSTFRSTQDVQTTSKVIENLIKEMGLIYFETVAHDQIAAARGVQIGEMREILFEDAGLTTTLIECQPTTALDLPLKILVWDELGDVYIAFIDPRFMKQRFMLQDCGEVVDDMGELLLKLANDAVRAIRELD